MRLDLRATAAHHRPNDRQGEPCPDCGGAGVKLGGDTDGPCPTCADHPGLASPMPTYDGQALVTMIGEHLTSLGFVGIQVKVDQVETDVYDRATKGVDFRWSD